MKEESFKVIKAKLRSGEFEFETLAIKGIRYSFLGKFVMTDFSDPTDESEILSGILQKYRNGKIIATIELTFDYWASD
jgi:hypothetical protein